VTKCDDGVTEADIGEREQRIPLTVKMTQLSTVDDYTNNVCFWNPWSRSITSSGGGSDTIRKLMIPSTTTPDHHGMASRGGRGGGGGIGAYTDANFAADMNDLTFAERQTMEEDIHGVADIIEETTELVTQRMEEMRVVLETKIPSKKRQAWDRAIFLRPGLVDDRKLYLLFLRARRFQSSDAAIALVAYFQAKRDLWGDDLLIHRITWNDVRVLMENPPMDFVVGSCVCEDPRRIMTFGYVHCTDSFFFLSRTLPS